MTNNEYQELIAFLGRKFDEADTRFAEVDRRLDQVATKEEMRAQQAATREYIDAKFGETRRHFDVVAEGLRGDIRQVAEGHQFLVDGQARIMERIDQLERELGAMIRISYAELDDRIRRCEQGLVALQERLARVEARQA